MTKKLQKQIAETEQFWQVYREFDSWLKSLGFVYTSNYDVLSYFYSFYDENFMGKESTGLIETYVQNELDLEIRIIKGKNKHEIMFVLGALGMSSGVCTLEEAKNEILTLVKARRDSLLERLQPLISL